MVQVKPEGRAEDEGDDSRRPGDAQPQPFYHDAELALQDGFFRFGFFVGLGIVDKEPHDVEHTRKPGNDEDNMQCFKVEVHFFVMCDF